MNIRTLKDQVILVAWTILFSIAVFVYIPGLHGPFVLDDFGTIAALGNFGGVTDWETFKAFVFGGQAGPTGRPVVLLTFLLDANDWPAESFPFKRTNLIIHLVNGALLGFMVRQVLLLLQYKVDQARWAALFSAALWLLHPFLVSTTLYAVQRMAQLSTMFIFAGLICHLYGRSKSFASTSRAYLLMSISIVFFTTLAVLSKENGILLPMLIGVLEVTVIASQRARVAALNRYWAFVFIVVPSVLVVAYLSRTFFNDDFFEIVPPRDFSLYERLLTQPRILIDYLQHWFIPKLYTTGVFQDHFTRSTGLFSPLTTVFCIVFHAVAISLAIVKRRKWPLIALATLFFYASHVLESTVLNLELYFEHRNYLAACFLFVPLIVTLQQKLSRQTFYLTCTIIILVLGGFTRYSATVWADYPSMVEASARKAPTSVRAQSQHATNLFNAGLIDESLQVLDQAISNIPGVHPSLLLNRAIILCNTGILDADENARVAAVLSESHYDPRMISVLSSFVNAVAKGRCPEVSIGSIREMFTGMLSVPINGNPDSLEYSQIQYFIGLTRTHEGDRLKAAAAFEQSLQSRPGASHAMQMAAVMASGGYYEEALHFSDLALRQLSAGQELSLTRAHVSRTDIEHFRAVVRADMTATPGDDSADPAQ